MVQQQMQLPFRVVKKRKCVGVQKKTVGVQCGSQPIIQSELRVPYAYAEKLERTIRTQEAELNRLRWFEFQYHHITQSKVLTAQRLHKVLYDYIEHQTHTGEYSGIFY